jgi:signal transduction histidine kinase
MASIKWWAAVRNWLQRYPMVVAGVLIYGYYLTTTLHYFQKAQAKTSSPIDFVLQYSSLLWMWIAAYIYLKLHQTKEKYLADEQHRLAMRNHLERTAVAAKVLNDVVSQLQDTINNPLTVIRISTDDIRKKFTANDEVRKRLDQIDSSMQRIHNAIKDISAYQSSQLLETMQAGIAAEMGEGQTNAEPQH